MLHQASLQGTRGCYESARSPQEKHKIWLADLSPDKNVWMDLEELEQDYLPEMWRNPPEAALRAGHGGEDYFEVLDFVRSIAHPRPLVGTVGHGTPCPIGIHGGRSLSARWT